MSTVDSTQIDIDRILSHDNIQQNIRVSFVAPKNIKSGEIVTVLIPVDSLKTRTVKKRIPFDEMTEEELVKDLARIKAGLNRCKRNGKTIRYAEYSKEMDIVLNLLNNKFNRDYQDPNEIETSNIPYMR